MRRLASLIAIFLALAPVAHAAVGDPQDRTRLGAVIASDNFASLTAETTCDGKHGRYDVQSCPNYGTGFDHNEGGAQCYGDGLAPSLYTVLPHGGVNMAGLAKVGEGLCAVTAYRSAWLSTFASFDTFQYGYIEVRAIMPSCGHAHWPNLWLMPAGGRWTGEIDFGEIAADGLTHAIHADQGRINLASHLKLTKACDGGSHTYGVFLAPGESVRWYLDRVEVAEETAPPGLLGTRWFLIMHLGLTPSAFSGAADAKTAPTSMIVQSWIAYGLRK